MKDSRHKEVHKEVHKEAHEVNTKKKVDKRIVLPAFEYESRIKKLGTSSMIEKFRQKYQKGK